nr:ABC transporter ATP-binding protein [Anaeromonas frigoriresistens]
MVINKGKITGLLGINGAGKTTTIKMLSTLIEPTKGTAIIDDLDLKKDANEIKKKINMIAGGERMLYWRLTGKENLWYYGQIYNIPKDILIKRINKLLKLVGLFDDKDTPVERYSKGMKQRLQIARGLINDPTYIFMDEPTLGLDAPIARDLREYVKKLADEEEKGILLTSHYMNEVEELCDYIYVLDNGILIAEGSAKELALLVNDHKILRIEIDELSFELEKAINNICTQFSGEVKYTRREQHAEIYLTTKEDVSTSIATLLTQYNASIKKFLSEEPKLEDTIISLARREKNV